MLFYFYALMLLMGCTHHMHETKPNAHMALVYNAEINSSWQDIILDHADFTGTDWYFYDTSSNIASLDGWLSKNKITAIISDQKLKTRIKVVYPEVIRHKKLQAFAASKHAILVSSNDNIQSLCPAKNNWVIDSNINILKKLPLECLNRKIWSTTSLDTAAINLYIKPAFENVKFIEKQYKFSILTAIKQVNNML